MSPTAPRSYVSEHLFGLRHPFPLELAPSFSLHDRFQFSRQYRYCPAILMDSGGPDLKSSSRKAGSPSTRFNSPKGTDFKRFPSSPTSSVQHHCILLHAPACSTFGCRHAAACAARVRPRAQDRSQDSSKRYPGIGLERPEPRIQEAGCMRQPPPGATSCYIPFSM